MKLIFVGSPGVGKGTYAEILSKNLHLPHIQSGAMFREEINQSTELGKTVQSYVESGELVPDEITNKVMRARLEQEDCKSGFILDGYPRNYAQAKVLAMHTKVDKVLFFVASDETIMRRMGSRQSCPKCQKIYNVITIKPKVEGKCDICSVDLEVRPDQRPKAVKIRLDLFRALTEPMIAYYKEQGILTEINSNPEINIHREELITNITKAILS